MKNLFSGLCLLLVFVGISTGTARAETAATDQFPERFMVRLGGYEIRNASTIARLDANDAPVGSYVDFQETLGGENKSTVFRLDSAYRFNDRHSLVFAWYDLQFEGSRTLSRDFTWGGQVYPISVRVDSKLKFDVYKLSYQYSLFHNNEAELGASFGFHILKTFAGINANGIGQSKNESVTAPMPVWGLFANYNFTPRFSAYYNYQFFFINYEDKIKGGLQDFLIGAEYRLLRHVALGVAYNRFGLHMKSVGDNATLYLDTNWNGGMLYASVYF